MPEEFDFPSQFRNEVNAYLHNIDAMLSSFPMTDMMLSAFSIVFNKELDDFIKEKCIIDEVKDDVTRFTVPAEHGFQYKKLRAKRDRSQAAMRITPQSIVVALVSQYDAFIGSLLRCVYRTIPGKLKSSALKISYEHLTKFKDLDDIKSHILEKKIERILRCSHAKQFDILKDIIDRPLRTDLKVWPLFIEITERRNLFVHCKGLVSAQYLKVCDEHNVHFDRRPIINDELLATLDYLQTAHAALYEIGAKLSYVVWRTIHPKSTADANQFMSDIIYDLIASERHQLAIEIGEFVYGTLSKKSDRDQVRRFVILNLSQAYKWSGNQEKANEIIQKEDWSSCNHMIGLGVALINDDFVTAEKKMRSMGKSGDMSANQYRDWPICQNFRKTQGFLTAFEEVYGYKYQPLKSSAIDAFFPLGKPGPILSITAAERGSQPAKAELNGPTSPE
jgi:predicted nucleic acid-binding Zn finger protein